MFGINNINEFKQSLTREHILRRMEVGQKVLRGLPVADGEMQRIGGHFTAPPPVTALPSNVIAAAAVPRPRRRRARRERPVNVVVEEVAAEPAAAVASKGRKPRHRKEKGA